MFDTLKLVVLALIVFFAALAADWARDPAYMVHALLIMVIAAGLFFWQLRNMPVEGAPHPMRRRRRAIWTGRSAMA